MNNINYLTREEMLTVPVDVVERIALYSQEIHYTMLKVKKYSNHPEDNFLYIVLAKRNPINNLENQYATWSWNDSTGGFNYGHYFDNADNANEDYDKRVYLADSR